MGTKVSTNVRVDEQLKKESVAILEELGFTLSSAVNIFLRQVVSKKGLPFDVRLTTENVFLKKEEVDEKVFVAGSGGACRR